MSNKIDYIIPVLKPGFVAMDANGKWAWFKYKPYAFETRGVWCREKIEHPWCDLSCFDIEPVEDWAGSLIRIEWGKTKMIAHNVKPDTLFWFNEKVYQWKMNDGHKELCDEKGNKIPGHKIPFGLYIEYAEVEVK